jgi:SNF2 family DNA or RNA helicase
MGKTAVTLAAFSLLRDFHAVTRLLVIAPVRPLRLVWRQEVAKWSDFAGLRVALAHGTAQERADALRSDADVYLINPENVAWLVSGLKAGTVKMQADMLAVDESTKFKNWTSVRMKALKEILPRFKRRYILTGTPAPQHIEDLFSQTYIMDQGQRLGRFITYFRKEYFVEEPQRGGYSTWMPKFDTEARIFAKLNGVAMRLNSKDYLAMPERTENVIRVELPPVARKAYDQMERTFFVEMQEGAVTAANAAAASMKLRQFANGWVYGTGGAGVKVHDAKIEALSDLVEEQAGQPLLVAVAFLHEVEAIRAALGYAVPYLGGGVSHAAADAIVADWNAGKLPVLLAHPSSVAHGLNLQAGGHALVWFGLTWSLEEKLQMESRVWRQGQKRGVVFHYIIAADTIDELIVERLNEKDAAQSRLFDSLKRYAERKAA